jgi:hypothetical protein
MRNLLRAVNAIGGFGVRLATVASTPKSSRS